MVTGGNEWPYLKNKTSSTILLYSKSGSNVSLASPTTGKTLDLAFRINSYYGLHRLFNPLNAELNPICYLLALLAHHFLHVSRIRVKALTLRLLMSYIYDISSLRVKE